MLLSNDGGSGGTTGRQQDQVIGGGGGVGRTGGMVMKKGPWSAAEDAVLVEYVKKHGEGNWNAVQRNTGLQRCGKSCRLRWANHLRPNLKKGAFNCNEERLIIDLHSKLGNKWARISAHLPGRTDNEIKNYWNTRIKRRIRQGLPLYPSDNQTPPPPPPPPPPLHPPSLQLSLPKTPPPTLSLFNPVSLSSPMFSLQHHPPPPLLPCHHSLKHCSQTSYMSNPLFPPPPLHISPMGFGFEPGRRLEFNSFGFGNPSFDNELPSNQYNQSNNNYVNGNNNHIEVENQVKANNNHPNVGRANNSGLLDDLLHEAHVKVGFKKETIEDDVGFQWDASSSENSSTGLKKEESEEKQLNFGSHDLSNILELIPSLVQVPTWCDDGGAESSAAQSSAVSTDDNYNNGLDDQLPQPPSFTDLNAADYDDDDDGGDWNSGSYTWDNLPKIC